MNIHFGKRGKQHDSFICCQNIVRNSREVNGALSYQPLLRFCVVLNAWIHVRPAVQMLLLYQFPPWYTHTYHSSTREMYVLPMLHLNCIQTGMRLVLQVKSQPSRSAMHVRWDNIVIVSPYLFLQAWIDMSRNSSEQACILLNFSCDSHFNLHLQREIMVRIQSLWVILYCFYIRHVYLAVNLNTCYPPKTQPHNPAAKFKLTFLTQSYRCL